MAKKILFIEDDLATIEVYTTALERAGFEVESILSGQEAIEKIKEIDQGKAEKPDLILLDYILPDVTGSDVLKEIRSHKSTKDIRVFLATNYADGIKKKDVVLKNEKFILKTDYPPAKMLELIKKELGA